jgi:HSP20 family molecular chaperone IbpA
MNDFWHDRFQREMMPFAEFNFNEPFLDFESSVRKVDNSQALTLTDNSFDVKLDVSNFTPSEIDVKVHNNALIIEGKHEETEDPHHYISRHFVRRFQIPEGVIMQDMKSKYSADGQLEIHAPREIVKPPPAAIASDIHIPITFIGKEAIEKKVNGA